MSQIINESVEKFIQSAKEFKNSNIMSFEKNVSILLHSAVDSEAVYNLIAKSMVNFDFVEEWKNAIAGINFVYPDGDDKKIAFIFSLLNNIDDRKLDIDKILNNYFSNDTNISSYENFCNNVIFKFEELILNGLEEELSSLENDNNDKNLKNDSNAEEYKEKIEEMLSLVYQLKDEVRKFKKIKGSILTKNDIIAIISTLEFAIKSNDLEYFYALVLSIRAMTCKVKKLKLIVLKIEELSNNLIRS